MPWAAIGAGVSVLSGLGNLIANSSANDRAEMLQNKAFQQWMDLHIPDPAEQKIALQQFVSQGTLIPKLQSAIKADPSAFQSIVTDSTQKAAQNRALSQLEDIGFNGGLRLQDKAAQQDAELKSQAQARGNRDAIAAEMARKGLSGSGYDVAARIGSQQGQADRDATSSLRTAASAQDRALQAIEGAGNMATQQRTQDFGEKSAKASAADSINKFNTQNLRDVNAANVGFQNRAQEFNLNNAQKISDQNTQLNNSEQMYNKGLAQQQYENKVKQVAGATGQANNVANTVQRGGQITGNAISNIGSGIAGAANVQANSDFWDNYFKKKNASSGAGDDDGFDTYWG